MSERPRPERPSILDLDSVLDGGTFHLLFEGHVLNFIECKNVDYNFNFNL